VNEFRFIGTSLVGETVRGNIFAPSRRAAWRRVQALADKHNFNLKGIERRSTFLFKVRHPSGKVIRGEQKAYTGDEIRAALERQGLVVLRIEKKLLDFSFRPSTTDLVLFVRLAANMLKRKLPFDEVLNLLAADTGSRSLRQMIRDLNSDLRGGMDAQHAFLKHQHILGKFAAYMLGLASISGNMAEMFEATAKYLERKNEFNKQVRAALITPTITLLAALGVFVWFIWFLIPDMMDLFMNYNVEIPPITRGSLAFAGFMDANYWWLLPSLVGIGIVIVAASRTTRGRFLMHKYMIRIPALGDLLHKLNLETFCRVFGVMYSGSGENEEIMKIAAEATGNTYIEHQIKTITVPLMVAKGTDLVQSMEASGVFKPMTLARFRSGTETGSVRESAEEMADFYENETRLKLEVTVESIKTAVAVVISILVALLTLVSTETAFMMPSASDILQTGI